MKRILFHSVKALVAFIILNNEIAFSQITEQTEPIVAHWGAGSRDLKNKLGISAADFKTFIEFYRTRIDSERNVFETKVVTGKVTKNNVDAYIAVVESRFIYLYKQFEEIKKEFPSSVSEYSEKNLHRAENVCNPGCTNIDFSNGTLSGWNAFYARNSSSSSSCLSVAGITGGACGNITQAANDPNSHPGSPGPDYQVEIMSGGNDPLAPSVPRLSPFGGKYTARVGDSTNPNYGVGILNQTFMVTTANINFTYQYAVFLENPTGHTYCQQPFFNVALLDQNGDTIPHCGEYNVVASNAKGYDSVYYSPSLDYVMYKNWTVVFASLKAYIGQCVTIQFLCSDCALGGHFGYAYVDASCSPLGLITSSPAFCGQKSIVLTAPPGGSSYSWSGPPNGIVGQDTAQSITVDSAGTYSVIVTPVTGKLCADTISITIPKAPGPPPVPSFTADTVCLGSSTLFTNTSMPDTGAGVKFYWDFYNTGTINDSTTNPTWTYNAAGTYTVNLYEVNNGCGTDTVIKVKVDSVPKASFTANNTCSGQNVTFTNNSTGASSYIWYFGNGDTSFAVNPTQVYNTGGTYTVTLIAKSAGACSDTVKETITITTAPKIIVSGKDTICPGASTTLTASGGTTYTWNPGSLTGTSVNVGPSVTTTYTVTGGGSCGGDTTYVVVVLPGPNSGIITKSDTICVGNSDTLIAKSSGSYTYSWSTTPAQTTDTIVVTPTVTTTYYLSVANGGKCPSIYATTITVIGNPPPKMYFSRDTICGDDDTVTLSVTGGAHYTWSTGATTSSIFVNPKSTTSYYVVITSRCFPPDTLDATIHIFPVPTPGIKGHDTLCAGTNTVLTATGGTTGTTYLWSTGATTSTITVSPASTTTYTVTETGVGKCSDSVSKTLIVVTPTARTISPPDSICAGSTYTLTATGGVTYLWSTGASTSSIVVSPASTTTYSVTVHSQCYVDTTMSSVLDIIPYPVPGITGNDSICAGGNVTLTATGGTTGTSYKWSTGATTSSITVNPAASTTYTITETNGNNCSASATKSITVMPVPNPTISGNNSFCLGDSTTLTANGGIRGTTYLWSTGATTSSIKVIPGSSGTTTVSVTETNNPNCTATATETITVVPVPVPSIKCSPSDTICPGTNTVLIANGGTAGTTYSWSNGATTSTIVVHPTSQTTYTVTETNGTNCSATATVVVHIKPSPVVNITGPSDTCQNETVTLTATGGGTYTWSNGMTGSSITFVATSTVNMYVVVTNGCADTAYHTITVNPIPNITACCDTTIAPGTAAVVTASGGVAYVWNPNNGTIDNFTSATTKVTPTVTTTYTVVGTGVDGCTSTAIVIVSMECFDIKVPNVFTPTQPSPNNVFYIANAAGEPSFSIEIYDRWGVLMYSSSDPTKSWDGTTKGGTNAPDGVYYYIIKSTCDNNNYDKHGFVQIIR